VSQELRDFLEAYLYLLLDQQAKISKFRGAWTKQIYTRFFFDLKIKSKEEAQTILQENFEVLLDQRLPEVLFRLAELPLKPKEASTSQTVPASKLYDFLIKKIGRHDDGSLEIPPLFMDREYLEYFFYTTDIDKWTDYFKNKGLLTKEIELALDPAEFAELTKAKFVEQYGLRVKLKRLK
jgi:hypothetical protein